MLSVTMWCNLFVNVCPFLLLWVDFSQWPFVACAKSQIDGTSWYFFRNTNLTSFETIRDWPIKVLRCIHTKTNHAMLKHVWPKVYIISQVHMLSSVLTWLYLTVVQLFIAHVQRRTEVTVDKINQKAPQLLDRESHVFNEVVHCATATTRQQ